MPLRRMWQPPATPKIWRITNVSHGVSVLAMTACKRAPARNMPALSASRPIMKPGSSAKLMIGKWKFSQSSMNRMAFSASFIPVAPPSTRESLIITPTG